LTSRFAYARTEKGTEMKNGELPE